MSRLPSSRIPQRSLLLASTTRLVSLPPSNVSGARGASRKIECSTLHVRMNSLAKLRLGFQHLGLSNRGIEQPYGARRAVTERVTASDGGQGNS